jgi:hypothetical protein
MSGSDREDGVKWTTTETQWTSEGKLMALYVNSEFVGHLGKYHTYWFFTMHEGGNHITLPGYLTEDEAKATAAVRWRMKL